MKKSKIKTKNQIRAESGKTQIGRKVGTAKENKALKEKEFNILMNYIHNDKDTRLTTLNKYRKIFRF